MLHYLTHSETQQLNTLVWITMLHYLTHSETQQLNTGVDNNVTLPNTQ